MNPWYLRVVQALQEMLLNTAASRENEEHDRDWYSRDCSGASSPRVFNDWSSVVSITPRYANRESANPFSSTIWTDTTSYSLSNTRDQDSTWWRTQVWLLSHHIILGLKHIFSNHQNRDSILHNVWRQPKVWCPPTMILTSHAIAHRVFCSQNQISFPLRQDGHFANAITRGVANLVDMNPGRISHGHLPSTLFGQITCQRRALHLIH